MKIAFLSSDKAREHHLADAFLQGARRHGHETEVIALEPGLEPGAYDVACMVGVKSRELFQAHRKAGIRVIYLDKGYVRQKRPDGGAGWEYWRVSMNEHHPTRRLGEIAMPSDRLENLNITLKPWNTRKRGAILLAGSSAKYHDFYGLREPNGWARRMIDELKPFAGGRAFIYRPKPSWPDGAEIRGSRFSPPAEPLGAVLHAASALVTHGSNACFEAVVEGVPCLILGNGVARPISSTEPSMLGNLHLASDIARLQWLSNLAYFQWTLHEMATGAAWEFISTEVYA